MNAHPLVQCRAKLAANASAQPLDVVKTKSVLQTLGHYDAPDWGLTPYPDPALFDAIKAFQKSQNLKVDGVINPDGETEATLSTLMTPRRATTALQTTAQAPQAMGRGGDELLAHITPGEAQLLHHVTDGASINPRTGLLEFFWGGSDRDDDGNGYDNDAQHGESDASAAEASDAQAAENDRQGRSADNGGRDDSPRTSHGESAGSDQGAGLNAASTKAVTVEEDEAKAGQTRTKRTKAQQTEDQSFSSGFFDTNEEEDEDDLDAQYGYSDASFASDDQAVENAQQGKAFSSRDNGDPAGYNDMSSVDAVNKERKNRQVVSSKKGMSGNGKQKVTIDLMTPANKALIAKGVRLGIKSKHIDPNDPRDKALIESYEEYGNKSPQEKKQAQKVRAEYRAYAQTNARAKSVYDDFKTAQGESLSFAAEKGSLGYLSDERLKSIEGVNTNLSYGFRGAGAAFSPLGVLGKGFGYLADDAKEELDSRK